jgi:hypothetical protein
MKITAGGKQKATGIVYVVYGLVEYEGGENIAVTSSRKLANLAIVSDRAIRKAAGNWPFDKYGIQRFKLDTAKYHTNFFTQCKVRSL